MSYEEEVFLRNLLSAYQCGEPVLTNDAKRALFILIEKILSDNQYEE